MIIKLHIYLAALLVILVVKGHDWYAAYMKKRNEEQRYKLHIINKLDESLKVNTQQHTELYKTIVKDAE